MQYNIRLRQEDISYAEFSRLLKGIMPETPLGKIVEIRSQSDKNILKQYGKYEKNIRLKWSEFRNKIINKDKSYKDKSLKAFQEACRQAFSNKEVDK